MTAQIIPGGPRVPAELVTDAGVTVESDASPVVQGARTIDFEGAGVTVTNVAGVAVVTISGGAGGTVVTDSTLTGNGLGGSPLGVDSSSLDGTVTVAVDGTTVAGDGLTGDPLHTVAGGTAVAVDGTTITGTGVTGNPLVSHAGGGGTVHTDATLTGDGSVGTPLGTVGGATAIAVDGTSIGGTGVTGTPIHTIAGGTAVAVDGTLTGNGLTGTPLHAIGGSLIAVYRPPTPADGDTVALHAGALNVVDIQNVAANGLFLQLPAANASPAGTPLSLALVNMGGYSDAQRGPFTIPPGIFGINAIMFLVNGANTINGVGIDGIFAIFTKSGDHAQLYSDGISDWIVADASWKNIQHANFALISSGLGNQLTTEADGPVPNQIYCTAAAPGDEIISLSAGYFGQIVTITNVDPTNAFLIVPDQVGIPLTDNCCYLTGNAQDYRVDIGESIQVQFGQRAAGGVPHLWFVIGHNTQLS